VKHCSTLVAGRCSNGSTRVGLDHTLAARQNMAIVMELQRSVLRGVRQRVEVRCAHMMLKMMVVLISHVRRGEMAERRRILMETGGNHVASFRFSGLGHDSTTYSTSRER
jgi:hypothetical protein